MSIRIAVSLLALLACGMAFAQDLGRKVSFECQATPAKEVVQRLSSLCGVPLLTAPQTENEVLALRIRDLPLEEVMGRIASAVDGTWRQESDGYRLIRPPGMLHAEQDREFANRVDQYRKEQAIIREELQNRPEFSPTAAEALAKEARDAIKSFNPNSVSNVFWQRTQTLAKRAPIGRVMSEIAPLLDPKELASLEPLIKVVYSSSPTPMQRALPDKVWPLIKRFVAEQNVWVDAAQRYRLANPSIGYTVWSTGGLADYIDGPMGAPAKVLLTEFKSSAGTYVQLELILADSHGKVIARASDGIGMNRPDSTASKPAKAIPGEQQIQMPDRAKSLYKALRTRTHANEQIPPDLREVLLHPELTDPLALLASDPLLQVAHIRDLNLVAVLTDGRAGQPYLDPDRPVSVDAYLGQLRLLEQTVKVQDGWLVCVPKRPAQERACQADRKVLGEFLRDLGKNGTLTIEERASFALRLPDQAVNALPEMLASMIAPQGVNYFNPNILRFYGSLQPEQRRQLPRGLPLGSLTPYQSNFVYRMLAGQSASLQFQPPPGAMNSDAYNAFYNGILREPTEALPNGIPANGILRVIDQTTEAAFSTPKSSSQFARFDEQSFTADDLAWQMFMHSRTDLFPGMDGNDFQPNLDELAMGRRRNMTFTFQFTPMISMLESLEETTKSPGRGTAFPNLPKAFVNQVQERIDSISKSYQNARLGPAGAPIRPSRGYIPPR